MNSPKRLFLIDAYALIFRGYYAFIKNPRINSKGIDTSAIFGFMNSLLDLIKREKPDHISVCFDKGGSKSRTEIYSEYKSNRHETPEAIKIAVPYIQKILKEMNISIIEKEGYEADDIIGTIAKKAEIKNFETYMVTPDKDFAQLVSEKIFIYRPARMGNGIEIWGVNEVKEKFEVDSPLQIIDYLGMMGDSVDNIPGLPGVGDKTAKKFIKQYGSIENLLSNTDQLKGKLKEKIEENKDLGILSKELAKILLNVPVNFDFKDFKISKPNYNNLNLILDELEFRRIKENISKLYQNIYDDLSSNITETGQIDLFYSQEEKKPKLEKEKKKKNFFQYLKTPFSLKLFTQKILKQKNFAFKIQTENIESSKHKIIGIGFSWEYNKGFYIPFPIIKSDLNTTLKYLKQVFESPNIIKIGYDMKKEIKSLSNHNITLKGTFFDTMVAHYLINPDRQHNLEVLANSNLNSNLLSDKELFKKIKFNEHSLEEQTEILVKKSEIILHLKTIFNNKLKENNNLDLFNNIEIPLIKVLRNMEKEGVKLDVLFLKNLSKKFLTKALLTETSIFKKAGEKFNIASPKQLGFILFEKLKIVDKPKKTKTGQFSTAEEILSQLAKNNEIVSEILIWRSIKKLLNTYVDALPLEINSNTDRIHTIYNQTITSTGRLSSTSPNLQNIPIRTEMGREIRKGFIPKSGNHFLLAADYSQIELRIIAALSNDPQMIKAFMENQDIHSSTASNVFGVPISEVTRDQRNNAKTINFGIIYGVSAFGLSQQTNLNRSESKELIDKYYKTYPNLRNFISKQIQEARDNGYVETILGRRRYLNDILSENAIVRGGAERNAINAPIQGSAADIIKIAMINIHNRLVDEKWDSKMILQVHDELIFDAPKNEIKDLSLMVKKEMESAYTLKVPLVVDIGIGKNWLEAH